VLIAVVELSARYHAPSTSLIARHLVGSRAITRAFRAQVDATLQRLLARGELTCSTHRGMQHWSRIRNRQQGR
jgi:hypothetical protein